MHRKGTPFLPEIAVSIGGFDNKAALDSPEFGGVPLSLQVLRIEHALINDGIEERHILRDLIGL